MPERLGLLTGEMWDRDPRHLLITLSRYKFVAKMLSGCAKVLEVGCGDAFGIRIVLQEGDHACLAVDIDRSMVQDVNNRMTDDWLFTCKHYDMLTGPILQHFFDGAYALDVLEHIEKSSEEIFMGNIVKSLNATGVLIIGTPSIQSQIYASKENKRLHINCKDHSGLKELMLKYFHNVFIFSMNDEVVHTGFYPMAHYLFALCCNKVKDDG